MPRLFAATLLLSSFAAFAADPTFLKRNAASVAPQPDDLTNGAKGASFKPLFGAGDPQARHLIWGRMQALLPQGKTIVLTTHFMDEAERLCARLAILDHGRIMAMDTPRALVATHIEPQVVEVFGDGAEAWAAQHGSKLCARCEQTGETVFCYAQNVDPLLANLATQTELRSLHRPANLEDVFLRLTGRDLRD